MKKRVNLVTFLSLYALNVWLLPRSVDRNLRSVTSLKARVSRLYGTACRCLVDAASSTVTGTGDFCSCLVSISTALQSSPLLASIFLPGESITVGEQTVTGGGERLLMLFCSDKVTDYLFKMWSVTYSKYYNIKVMWLDHFPIHLNLVGTELDSVVTVEKDTGQTSLHPEHHPPPSAQHPHQAEKRVLQDFLRPHFSVVSTWFILHNLLFCWHLPYWFLSWQKIYIQILNICLFFSFYLSVYHFNTKYLNKDKPQDISFTVLCEYLDVFVGFFFFHHRPW